MNDAAIAVWMQKRPGWTARELNQAKRIGKSIMPIMRLAGGDFIRGEAADNAPVRADEWLRKCPLKL